MSILDTTADDIRPLGDADLRKLVGKLCEAELASQSLPTSRVFWGGHQDAADGGLDVRVDLPIAPSLPNFIVRPMTGFQVKRSGMPPQKILNEMKPGGTLRESIRELVSCCGSYVIVTNGDDCTDSVLARRLAAMAEAVADQPAAGEVHLDFYDRSRLAGWVRRHPSVEIWLRSTTGKPLAGWRPFGTWTQGAETETGYLVDEDVRIDFHGSNDSDGESGADGIRRLRRLLEPPKSSVRLVGLSGVGKTRLAQALFEPDPTGDVLDKQLVIYTDLGDEPEPGARAMSEVLVANGHRAYLVVDNCPPDVHRQLTRVTQSADSRVSLLTLEYDVVGDEPEGTDVVRLEPASEDLVADLVRHRHPQLGDVNARSIASFSGGNPRLAMVLARTVTAGESVGSFGDAELFDRLFLQRRSNDPNLLAAAEALTLVYSFDGESVSDSGSELSALAALVDETPVALRRASAELRRRELVQQRGRWRAVLPHALAHRLATRALENIPRESLKQLEDPGCERLLRSFSRRLGFLHDSGDAQRIATEWLSNPESPPLRMKDLTASGVAILTNIAPIAPDATLSAIESIADAADAQGFASRENPHFRDLTHLLRKLAYEPTLFARALALLVRFAATERSDENADSIADLIKGLFQLYLSGTHATPSSRAAEIHRLLDSSDQRLNELGLVALESSLEAWHFRNMGAFSFGSRSRDIGYSPSSTGDVKRWFRTFIPIASGLACSQETAPRLAARKILARQFRGLWTKAGMAKELEDVARAIRSEDVWVEGWLSARDTLRFDSGTMDPAVRARLEQLAEELGPTDLEETARAFAFTNPWELRDPDEDVDTDETESRIVAVGAEVARDPNVLNSIISDLVSKESNSLGLFGRGIALGTEDLESSWDLLLSAYKATESSKRNISVLCGYLRGVSERSADGCERILDRASDDSDLRLRFIPLLVSAGGGQRFHQRLMQYLATEDAEIAEFQILGFGRSHDALTDEELADVLRALARTEPGRRISMGVLSMRFYGVTSEDVVSASLRDLGQGLVARGFPIESGLRATECDHEFSRVVERCLTDDEAAPIAEQLLESLRGQLLSHAIDSFECHKTARLLASRFPLSFLDAFVGGQPDRVALIDGEPPEISRIEINPLDGIEIEDLTAWADKDPLFRYGKLAGAIDAFALLDGEGVDSDQKIVVSSKALDLLSAAPDPRPLVALYSKQCIPMSWSGSRSVLVAANRVAFEELTSHDDPRVVEAATEALIDLRSREETDRQYERRELASEQSFE